MDLMAREAAAGDQAGSGRAQGASRHTLLCPGGVSAAQLLPLLRLACMGATAEVRSAASQLAARRLRDATGAPLAASAAVAGAHGHAAAAGAHGHGTAAASAATGASAAAAAASTEMAAAAAAAECLDEAQLWLWMLPTIPIHGSVTGGALAGRTGESSVNRNDAATTQLSASPAAAARSEAVASFLCNAVVQLTRRPHEVYELVQELLAPQQAAGDQASGSLKAPTRTATGATGEDAGPRLALEGEGCERVSLLAVACVRGCLKALPSQKMAAADKQAICSYVAGAGLGELSVLSMSVPENQVCVPLKVL